MKSFNAKRLYELICKWKDLGKTKMMYVDEWKEFFGVTNKYPKIFDFKRRVLDPAIEAINAQDEFHLTLEQLKVGRNITHFQIIIKKLKTEKTKEESKAVDTTGRDKDTPDMFHKMTESQLDTFSGKLSDLSAVQSMANVGETMPSFKARLRSMLKDQEKQKKLVPYLKQVGFKL
jgi:plasmid replication initiation protein